MERGPDVGRFGGSVNAETVAYMISQRKRVAAEVQARKTMQMRKTEKESAQRVSNATCRTGPRTDELTGRP